MTDPDADIRLFFLIAQGSDEKPRSAPSPKRGETLIQHVAAATTPPLQARILPHAIWRRSTGVSVGHTS